MEDETEGYRAEPVIPPSNRLLKLLLFFGVPNASDLSADEAWEARAAIFADPAKKERWSKYVYLTHDVDSESPDLKPFDPVALEAVILPPDWSAARAEREYREQTAVRVLEHCPLYDTPQPPILFEGRVFLFTGKFDFATRTRCEQAVRERGGLVPEDKEVSHLIDYLVVGTKGSARWKHEAYGANIEAAVVERHILPSSLRSTGAHTWRPIPAIEHP